jgi:hydrogenase-4 component E
MDNILIMIFGITTLYLSVTSMIGTFIKILIVQGFILFLVALLNTSEMNYYVFIFVAIETLLFKSILIPWFLMKTVKDIGITREIEPYIPSFYSLLVVSFLFVLGFAFSILSIRFTHSFNPISFGVSMSTIMSSLFIIITRKKLITHIMGYMLMENGIFLLSLSVAKEMPVIVSLGVSLDIFIGVLLAGLFINRIKSTFDEQDVDTLSLLRD